VHLADARGGEISGWVRETRNKEEIPIPGDYNEIGKQREREREREREKDGKELGEKLMKNIKIRRRKEARELKHRRGLREEGGQPSG